MADRSGTSEIDLPGEVAALIAALDDPETAPDAARALGRLRSGAEPEHRIPVAEALVAAFVRDPSPMLCSEARSWAGDDVAGPLCRALEGADAAARREIEVALSDLGSGAVPHLIELLRDPEAGARLVGVRALHRIRRSITRQIQEGHRRAVVEANRSMRGPGWLSGAQADFTASPRGAELGEQLRRADAAAVPLRAVAHGDPDAEVRTTAQKAVLDFPEP